MLDYPLLEALAAVNREGSFERAAQVLNLTASAVSQRIKLLEQRIGTVLVVRGQPCRATPRGQILCRHIELVGQLERSLEAQLPELGQEELSTVSMAVNADSLATWFLNVLADLHEARVRLEIVADDQDYTVERLRSGSVQAAVTTMAEPVQGCVVKPLGALRYIATCSPAFRDRYFKNGLDAKGLETAPCLVFDRKDGLQSEFIRRLVGQEVHPPRHFLPSTEGFHHACRMGLAWGLNPLSIVAKDLEAGVLVEMGEAHRVDVELYWQVFTLSTPMLDLVSQTVLRVAKHFLVQ